jgi:aryl-alcohol dehydrogenase-like predicted oxidoreductase
MRLGIGSAQFGMDYGIVNRFGQTRLSEVKKIIETAKYEGISLIDTAANYGKSEEILGSQDISFFDIVSKIPAFPRDLEETSFKQWSLQQVSKSLANLNIDCLYGLLFHDTQLLLSSHGAQAFDALNKLKKAGLTKKIGISVYNPDELEYILDRFHFDIVQLPLNIVDRRFVELNWLDRLKNLNIEIHTRSVFLQGLLLQDFEDIPPKFMRWNELWKNWTNWVIQNSHSHIQACLSYPLSFDEVDKVIVGLENVAQMNEIIKYTKSKRITAIPDFSIDDESLLNPSLWNKL